MGQSLRCSPGRGNPLALWHCMWGEGSEREQCCLLSSWLPFSHFPDSHKLIGPFWCRFLGVWVCVCSRSLWLFPTDSPERLGASPATTTPTGFIRQRFEALFPCAGTLGCTVCLAPPLFLPVYLHANVGPPTPPDAAGPIL